MATVDALIQLLDLQVIIADKIINRILMNPAVDLLVYFHTDNSVGAYYGQMHYYSQHVHW